MLNEHQNILSMLQERVSNIAATAAIACASLAPLPCIAIAVAVAHEPLSPLLWSLSLGKARLSPQNEVLSQKGPLCSTKLAKVQAKRNKRKMHCLPQYMGYDTEKEDLPQGQHAMHQCAFYIGFIEVADGGEELTHDNCGHCVCSGEC